MIQNGNTLGDVHRALAQDVAEKSGRQADVWLLYTGTRSRLNLVLVHAQDDTTMPWSETEALFLSTVEAGQRASHNCATVKVLQINDLGEAGRQETWQNEAVYVSKTIAKHGGKSQPLPLDNFSARRL